MNSELKASFNLITEVPSDIGKLKRLRKLTLNGNRIRTLPPEVGRLEMLEELIVSENAMDEMPHTLATMAMLRVLKVSCRLCPADLLVVVAVLGVMITCAGPSPPQDASFLPRCV